MTLADLFAAIDRVERGDFGYYRTPALSEYVVDPRKQTLWDLKPVFGLLVEGQGVDVRGSRKAMTSDTLKARVRGFLPDLTLSSFLTEKMRRLGMRRHDANLSPVEWPDAIVQAGSVGEPASVVQSSEGGVAYYLALTKIFLRDAGVVDAAKKRAAGRCEHCLSEAPFLTGAGMPYLEVHHVVPLSQDGEDCLGNVLALCPNCHRMAHFGEHGLSR
ncbi:MAG: hypothetical protein B7Z04_13290 [Rhodobacterales bacterium 32-66-9]|nr:MAG: hypothetical protein B7Z04_13290 [Rhodobacterales bacterium 32-66-9]